MNIVLLDDCGSHNEVLQMMLSQICERNKIPVVFALQATRLEEVLAYAASMSHPQTVYFLDIQLEQEQTGIDICRQLHRDGVRDRFIFVSAYPQYAMDCLKVHAYDLLLKPLNAQELEDCVVSLYRDMAADNLTTLDLPIGSRTVRVPIKEIYYIEAQGRNVRLCASTGVYTYAAALASLEEKLDPHGFIRIHRKYLINSAWLQEWDRGTGEAVVNGEHLPVSRRLADRLTDGR